MSNQLHILSTLPLPGLATLPTENCIQWTGDGQVVLLTRQAITSELGIKIEPSSILRPPADIGQPDQHRRPLGWYKTMIERGKDGEPHQWAYDCQEWSAASLGSTDLAFLDISCSPSGTSSDAGSVFAALDSNFEVSLYKPVKNRLTGQWEKIGDLLDILEDTVTELATEKESSIPDLLLTLHKQLSSDALLACGIADGSVEVLKISQSLELSNSPSSLLPNYQIRVTHETFGTACKPMRRTTGTLCWIAPSLSEPVLIFSKPGTIHFWKPVGKSWDGYLTVALKTQKQSVGSTAMAPISGIVHLPRRDAIAVSLSDGSFHVVKDVSSKPALASDDQTDAISSRALSIAARQHFVRIEGDEIRKLDVNCTHGMTTVDEDFTFLWIQEATRPTDFMYKHDAQHNSTLVMAELFHGESESRLLADLKDTIRNTSCTSGETGLAIFRRFLIRLSNSETIESLVEGLLEIVSGPDPVDDTLDVDFLPSYDGDFTADLRLQFRNSLRTRVFGRSGLLSRRLRVCLANYCETRCEVQELQNAFRLAGNSIAQELWTITLRILIVHIIAVSKILNVSDIAFVRRVAIHANRSGISEADTLLASIDKITPATQTSDVADPLQESCPACHALIPFTDHNSAVCSNGHHWLRCSITSYVLSTPMVRTCTSCTRKAFLPPPVSGDSGPGFTTPWLPIAARSWLVEDLLYAVRRCWYCENNFVTLV
ncbi:putative zinc-finger of transcription factor IIIC complex-domain-containing protein [Irpex rosettiformis]|uniref:Zinc-finger of transcription factor IIIC complex-domain-containing protein n=1 Tax=Irpex rosettiformis TaxID=378272 RepID=A0ACB8TWW6_9APHY|nr:putative zinc-finger of transcription factor IIIC complex-domain-containing protein [Irpex rosettiformis]